MTRTVCWGLLIVCTLWTVFYGGLCLCNLLVDRLPEEWIERIDRHLAGDE